MKIKKASAHCLYCNIRLTNVNNSKEHLIANSIGGRKKITNIWCIPCNNKSGSTWDKTLANQLNPLSLFFRITRQNGQSPAQKFNVIGGGQIQLFHDGHIELAKSEIAETKIGNHLQINIKARSRKEAKQIIMGKKRKYPKLNTEEILNQLDHQSLYFSNPILMNFSFGGSDTNKSIIKSVLTLAAKNDVNPKYFKNALNYLKDINSVAYLGFYYEKDVILNRPPNQISHCVAVSGNSKTGLLLGYVEFFSTQRIVVCLSDSYDGPNIHKIYAINPISGKELNLKFKISLTGDELEKLYRGEKASTESMKMAFENAIKIGMNNNREFEIARISELAADYAFKNCGAREGEVLTKEHLTKIASLMTEKLMPFLMKYDSINAQQILK